MNFWESLLRGLAFFNKTKDEETVTQETIETEQTELDFIDYDGMGNQGRFVSDKKNKKSS